METLDPTVRLVLEGILTQVPATLVATGLLACAGWLFRAMRRRGTRLDQYKKNKQNSLDARSSASSYSPRRSARHR